MLAASNKIRKLSIDNIKTNKKAWFFLSSTSSIGGECIVWNKYSTRITSMFYYDDGYFFVPVVAVMYFDDVLLF